MYNFSLHNFLLNKKSNYITPALTDRYDDNGAFIPGTWRNDLPLAGVNGKENTPSSYVSNEAKSIREELEQYFMSATGKLSWQYKHV